MGAERLKLFTAAEVALAIGCDESTIRRQAARAWDSNNDPGPLAKNPSWRVVKRSAPEGGQGCGWLLARSEKSATLTPKIGHVFQLAVIIKESCEECTDQEATRLAQLILEHPKSRWTPADPQY